MVALLLVFTPNTISEGVTFVGSNETPYQAILFIWNTNGTEFIICNENGIAGENTLQVYKLSTFTEMPYVDLDQNTGTEELLDANWCPWTRHYRDFVAIAGGIAGAGGTPAEIEIWNRSTTPWTFEAYLDVAGKSHSLEWHPNQEFLIGEDLTSGTTSYLNVWDCSDNDPSNWVEVRSYRDGSMSDIFNMFVNDNKSLLSWEKNDAGYVNYKVHVWDISDSNPDNWGDISGSPLNNREVGSFTPNGNFIVTRNAPGGSINYIYYTSNLSLYKTIDPGVGDPRFSPDTVDTPNQIVSGYMVGYQSSDQNDLIIYNISDDWSITEEADIMPSGTACRCNFNPNGSYIGIASGVADETFKVYTWDFPINDSFVTPDEEAESSPHYFIDINNESNGSVLNTNIRWYNVSFPDTVEYIDVWNLNIANDSDFVNILINITDINESTYGDNFEETNSNMYFKDTQTIEQRGGEVGTLYYRIRYRYRMVTS